MKLIPTLLAGLIVAACGAPEPPPRTVNDLAEDPAVLQGLAARCEADKTAKFTDIECANARRARDRLGGADDAKLRDERAAEFERLRAERRARDDAANRAATKANPPYDPYSAPISADPSQSAPKP